MRFQECPIIAEWRALRPRRQWPTTWSTNAHESFAEGFALFKTDPDALERVSPEALQWFRSAGHLRDTAPRPLGPGADPS